MVTEVGLVVEVVLGAEALEVVGIEVEVVGEQLQCAWRFQRGVHEGSIPLRHLELSRNWMEILE